MTAFNELGLNAKLIQNITAKGYDTPSPIQAKAIPQVLSGCDLMAAAQTGTGKTAAFTLPVLHMLKGGARPGPKDVSCLILTPTRELAAQIADGIRGYGAGLKLHSQMVCGGVNIRPQIRHLARGTDILVATPGRLLDLLGQGAVPARPCKDVGARRGRQNARYGLYPRDASHPRGVAQKAPDADVFGNVFP
jgi:ATP-dependent RNA helicase RhlE